MREWFGNKPAATTGKSPNGKSNKGSFGSDNSFESFGSMENGEPLFILNPFEYTVHHSKPTDELNGDIGETVDNKPYGKKTDEAHDSSVMADFEAQQDINWRIQTHMSMAVRDEK